MKEHVGDHGHARAAFRRALERGNFVVAELEARDVGPLDLAEALELTALIALRDRERGARYARHWLQRWLEEKQPTPEEGAMAAACLSTLCRPEHVAALACLRLLAYPMLPRSGYAGASTRAMQPGVTAEVSVIDVTSRG
jgi:hypothetical protein